MKHLLFATIFILSITNSFAQQYYIPFVKTDKYWFYMTSNGGDGNPPNIAAYAIWFQGDTIITNENYLKVYISYLRGTHPCQFPPCFTPNFPYEFSGKSLIGFVTEDTINKLVYFLPKLPSSGECIDTLFELYNFNLNIGDSISSCHLDQMSQNWSGSEDYGVIETSDFEFLFGQNRKVMTFHAPHSSAGLPHLSPMQLIEGIGMTYYDPFSYTPYTTFFDFCESHDNQCAILSNILEIQNNHITIFPNPTNGTIKITGFDSISNVTILDLKGKAINYTIINDEVHLGDLQNGIYILKISDKENNSIFKKIIKL